MITIPSLAPHTKARPGSHDFEPAYLVPDHSSDSDKFWNTVYRELKEAQLKSPIEANISELVNPEYGYFGPRPHPVISNREYFHLGIEYNFPKILPIHPVQNGVLEYSGYGAINGYYVLLSHPDIKTEDGYILHSMYCHLKKPLVNFTSYQKMLREVSLGSYPIIFISEDTLLGNSGSSGVVSQGDYKLYLQFDFRKYGETPIVIDPLRVLTGEVITNIFDLNN